MKLKEKNYFYSSEGRKPLRKEIKRKQSVDLYNSGKKQSGFSLTLTISHRWN